MSIFNYQIIQDLRERAANVPFRRACCYDINYFVIFIAVSRLNSWVNGSATRHARTIINSLYLWCGYRVRSGECHHVRSSRCGSNSLVELFCYVVISFALFIIVIMIISVVWEDTWRWFVKWHRTRNKNIQRMRFFSIVCGCRFIVLVLKHAKHIQYIYYSMHTKLLWKCHIFIWMLRKVHWLLCSSFIFVIVLFPSYRQIEKTLHIDTKFACTQSYSYEYQFLTFSHSCRHTAAAAVAALAFFIYKRIQKRVTCMWA